MFKRQERLKREGLERKERAKARAEMTKGQLLKIPGKNLRNFSEIGWTWTDVFDVFEGIFKIDRLVVIEEYASYLNVPYLKKDQLKLTYQPDPQIISKIAKGGVHKLFY